MLKSKTDEIFLIKLVTNLRITEIYFISVNAVGKNWGR